MLGYCEHITAVLELMREKRVRVVGEFTEGPRGWVNIFCETCGENYPRGEGMAAGEILLDYRSNFGTDPDEEE